MIRRAKLGDILPLAALEEAAFKTDRISPRSLRHLLISRKAAIFVEEEGETLRGSVVVLFQPESKTSRLYSLAVGPSYRRTGLGKALLLAAEGEARRRGCRGVRLEVAEGNLAARSLYEGAGYVFIKKIRLYYEDGETAVRMKKDLRGDLPGAGSRRGEQTGAPDRSVT